MYNTIITQRKYIKIYIASEGIKKIFCFLYSKSVNYNSNANKIKKPKNRLKLIFVNKEKIITCSDSYSIVS